MSDFQKLKDEFKGKLTKAKNSQEVDIIRTDIFGKNGLINSEFKNRLNSTQDSKEIEAIRTDIFSKNGFINSQFKKLGSLSEDEKKTFASNINKAKQELLEIFRSKATEVSDKDLNEKIKKEKIDVTLPEKEFKIGKIHPVSQVIDEISCIFSEIGFSVEEGPDVENDYNNFTALNTPEDHPAKDMHDTFYLDENMKTLLRTHTSPVQVRTMLKGKPPFKIIAPGRTYRSDSDQTHTPMFHQLEGLHIDKNINMGHLKGCLNYFIKEFFEVDKIKMRFRPSHFPFTEPSAEVDIGYRIEKNKIIIGEGDKWLEVLGCGMVHPNVLKNCKVDPKNYQGFAFGIGIDRLAMLKYGINDLRSFFECDYRWLNYYGFDPLDVPTNYRGLSK